MAAPAFGSAGTVLAGASSGTAAVAVPSGVAAGDIIIVSLYMEANRTITAPSGFTLVNGAPTATSVQWHYVYWKRATAGDTGTYSFTFTSTYRVAAAIRITGAVTAGNPIDVFDQAARASTGTVTPAVTVTTAGIDRLLVWLGTNFSTGTWTPPTSYTTRIAGTTEITGATRVQAAAGSSGSVTGSSTGSNQQTGYLLAIIPASTDQSVTMTAGIPTGEAFGTGSFTAGAVSATAGSIPTAEAFGASTVSQVVASPSIPTAEAFSVDGELIVVGVVTGPSIPSAEAFGPSVVQLRNLESPSIPTAESFGLGTVAAGPVSVTSASIPSAETFGPHQVNVTLYSPSIPTALVLPGGAVVVGPVSILSVSIPSAESFGDSEVTLTLDPTKRIRPVRVRIVPLYEVLVVGRVPAQSGPPTFLEVDPIDWLKITWSSTLSRPQKLSVTCKTSTITESVAQRLRAPDRLPTELWVSRNGRRVFAGPVLGGGRNGDELTLQCGGLLTYLQWMIVAADMRFDQVDQFGIVASLIDQWQSLEFGHFGIDTSSVGASGVLRDRSYVRDEIHQVSRRVEELGAVRDGFDTEVDPTTRKLQLWYPGKGVDRSTGDDAIVFDGRNIDDQNAMFSIAPGDLASDAYGTSSKAGSEAALWSEQSNAELRAAFGRTAVTGSWSDVEEQATLNDHVGALLDARDQPLRAPGQKVRVPADADLDAYAEGDVVSYELDDLLGIGGAWRIRSRNVTVEQTGAESVDLEFV